MQSSASFFQGQPRSSRDGVLCWLRAAAWLVVAGAVSPSVLAQAPADSAAGEKTEAASEPPTSAAPDTASPSEPSSGPATWNRRPKASTGVDAQLKRLAVDLKLDAAQQAKIRPILIARNEQMQRLQQETKLPPPERRQRALAVGDHSAEQIRAQLTEAQRAQYIGPRTTTVVAQAGPTMRRSGMAPPPATAPKKGAAP